MSRRGDKAAIRAALHEARERTRFLDAAIPDALYAQAAATYLSPPNWDFGHIANFEELWLVQTLAHRPESSVGVNDIYNAFQHERRDRPHLPLLDRSGVATYQDQVRQAALDVLADTDTSTQAPRLTRDGFVYWMLVLHEHQHQETILQSMAMHGIRPNDRKPCLPVTSKPTIVDIPGGTFTMGRKHGPGVYDNEAPPHPVAVGPMRVASTPVTVGEYLEFVLAGGYEDETWWCEEGNVWRRENNSPLYWDFDGEWFIDDLQGRRTVASDATRILCNINYYEARAYAAFRDARLPTEAEWEYVARNGGADLHPWGDEECCPKKANMDHLTWGPGCAGAGPANKWGIQHLIGDVWEWTSSPFEAYPNTQAYPYPEYSAVFYKGDYRVLRGGSWAARGPICTATFRNWDVPKRQQIFAGVRLWYDAL